MPDSERTVRIYPLHARVKVDGPCVVAVEHLSSRCPGCERVGHWRSGVYFDNERRCGTCSIVWEPDTDYLVVRPLKQRVPEPPAPLPSPAKEPQEVRDEEEI